MGGKYDQRRRHRKALVKGNLRRSTPDFSLSRERKDGSIGESGEEKGGNSQTLWGLVKRPTKHPHQKKTNIGGLIQGARHF